MESSKREDSLFSRISLPKWMISNILRCNLKPAVFSPPNDDDSLFFPSYSSKQEKLYDSFSDSINSLNEVDWKVSEIRPLNGNDPRLVQLTSSCQPAATYENFESPNHVITSIFATHFKHSKVEDGFITVSNGRTLFKGAQQMINHHLPIDDISPNESSVSTSYSDVDESNTFQHVSPSVLLKSSPKSSRKNPFFTDSSSDSNQHLNKKNAEKNENGKIFSALSSQHGLSINKMENSKQRVINGSKNSLVDTVESSLNSKNVGRTTAKVLHAKPSRLREMNFWSPTSM